MNQHSVLLVFFLLFSASGTLGSKPICEVHAQELKGGLAVSDSPMRTWRTPDGKFTREGKLIELFPDRIRLELPDGKTPVVETGRLCEADLDFLEGERKRLTSALGRPSEKLMPLPPPYQFKSPNPSVVSSGGDYRLQVTLDTYTSVEIRPSDWRPNMLSKFAPMRVTCFRNDLNLVRLTGFAGSPNSRFFAMSFESAWGFDPDALESSDGQKRVAGATHSWIEVYDLVNRKMLGRHFLRGKDRKVKAIDDTGSIILVFDYVAIEEKPDSLLDPNEVKEIQKTALLETNDREIKRLSGLLEQANKEKNLNRIKTLSDVLDRLRQERAAIENGTDEKYFNKTKGSSDETERSNAITVYSIENNRLVPKESFSASYHDEFEFLDEGKVLQLYQGGFAVWKLDPLKFLYRGEGNRFKLSLTRDQMIVSDNLSKDFLVDLNKGELLGKVNGTALSTGETSPDGKRVARWELAKLVITDPKGELQDEFYCPLSAFGVEVSWFDNETVCLEYSSNRLFVDLESRITMLCITDRLSSGEILRTVQARRLSTKKGQPYSFEIFQLPGPDMVSQLVEECKQQLPKDLERGVLLKPGDRVRLTTDFQANESEKDHAISHVTKLLETRGIVIDSNASDEFRISVEAQKNELGFRTIGGFDGTRGNGETAVETKVIRTLALVRQGVACWGVQQVSGEAMPLLFRREGESLQQAVDRQAVPGDQSWSTFSLPKHIMMHPRNLPAVWVEITPNGLKRLK